MEHCFQCYVPFTNHTQYRARARERNNTVQILNYTRLHTHTHTLFISMSTSYVHMHIYIADMRTKKVSKCAVTYERSFLVKILNINVMPTLRGFRRYPYFVSQE